MAKQYGTEAERSTRAHIELITTCIATTYLDWNVDGQTHRNPSNRNWPVLQLRWHLRSAHKIRQELGWLRGTMAQDPRLYSPRSACVLVTDDHESARAASSAARSIVGLLHHRQASGLRFVRSVLAIRTVWMCSHQLHHLSLFHFTLPLNLESPANRLIAAPGQWQ